MIQVKHPESNLHFSNLRSTVYKEEKQNKT